MSSTLRSVAAGVERLRPGFDMPRHRHLEPYATLVLEGSFREIGYGGRVDTLPGDVLIHRALDTHQNKMLSKGVRLLRLPWPIAGDAGKCEGAFRVERPQEIVDAASSNVRDATRALQEQLCDAPRAPRLSEDWPDLLAADLAADAWLNLGDWAARHTLRAETVSRGFKAAYGVSPSIFRLELHARQAWLEIVCGRKSFTRVAAESGFADHAHMSRTLRAITGQSPTQWRSARPDQTNPWLNLLRRTQQRPAWFSI